MTGPERPEDYGIWADTEDGTRNRPADPQDPRAVTQARHPWRATARTVLAAAVSFLPLLPVLVDVLGLQAYAWAAGTVAVAGAITRALAVPAVNTWLARYVPVLAAAPKADVADRL